MLGLFRMPFLKMASPSFVATDQHTEKDARRLIGSDKGGIQVRQYIDRMVGPLISLLSITFCADVLDRL